MGASTYFSLPRTGDMKLSLLYPAGRFWFEELSLAPLTHSMHE